jgi:protein-serine/threonine kinase
MEEPVAGTEGATENKPVSLSSPPASSETITSERTTVPHPSTASDVTRDRNVSAFGQNVQIQPLNRLDTSFEPPKFHIRTPSTATPSRSPLTPNLHIRTDIPTPLPSTTTGSKVESPKTPVGRQDLGILASSSQPILIERPGLRSTLSAVSMNSHHSLSPGSAMSSPALAAMTDITPLPSPIMNESPGQWRRGYPRPGSAGSYGSSVREELLADQIADTPETPPTRHSPTKTKKKAYGNLLGTTLDGGGGVKFRRDGSSHSRNRSMSEFVPEVMHNVRPRNVTYSAVPDEVVPEVSYLHREQYLAEQRGLVHPPQHHSEGALPTPPPSNRSVTGSEGDEVRDTEPFVEYLTVKFGTLKRKKHYRPVRPLGQGTFSKVVLATSEKLPPKTTLNEASESSLDPAKLVAIKIVQHGPAGGADEERVELGLRREIEILRDISHPSLIHLQAFDFNDHEALLVLNYCPGGDLFDLASQHQKILTPALVQRMFAELVDACRYLHDKWIVHRDIKLENVLLNMPPSSLPNIDSPSTYPHPLITLTDLGLSRPIPQPPESPLLTTRCGSEDYAAPEILLSQPYDGRQTDAWALGVLLYALMEGRLPFDPPPVRPGGKPIRGRSRAAHRIARCDWMWCLYGDDDGEWDATRGAGWEGARECVEGLLKKVSRGRLSCDELAQKDYVKEGIQIEGGLRRLHDEVDNEEMR